MSMAISTTIETSFAEAVDKTREALSDQGFGVLTEIDVTSTLKQKADEDMEDYLILGACNPPLAHQALGVDRQIGLLLRATSSSEPTPTTRARYTWRQWTRRSWSKSPNNPTCNRSPTTPPHACAPPSPRSPTRRDKPRPSCQHHATMTISLALLFGALIGVLLGLLGGGGRILAVPALVYAVGLDMEQAIPVSLIVIGVASAVGALPKIRVGHVQWRLAAVSPRRASRPRSPGGDRITPSAVGCYCSDSPR